ncbi:MAG: SET domain-containing protein-lysine N-methyltransferase [Planctomycetota bacterium]
MASRLGGATYRSTAASGVRYRRINVSATRRSNACCASPRRSSAAGATSTQQRSDPEEGLKANKKSNKKTNKKAKKETKKKAKTKPVIAGKTHLGRAAFANRRFKPEQLIAEIPGEIISDPDYGSDYCMDCLDGCVIEADPPFRFLNHSCEPNCELVIWEDWEDGDESLPEGLCLYARIKIKAGEELTIDYSWPADAAIPCKCGAPTCRGWIVAPEELKQLKKRNRR